VTLAPPATASTRPLTSGRSATDVAVSRERQRRLRLRRLAAVIVVPAAYLWFRIADGRPFDVFAFPQIDWLTAAPLLFFATLIVVMVGGPLLAGRSPHITYRPEQIDVRLSDVVGVDAVREDAVRSLDLFLGHRAFTESTGGTPRRGLLFEGPPGTGKTYLAKAMAAEAGVPFLFVSATSFQSMFYGATARKIRSYFRALRKAAQAEGGAIGFIEEIDAIATTRGGLASATPITSDRNDMTSSGMSCCSSGLIPAQYGPAQYGPLVQRSGMVSEGVGGVVNELLVQMQSFDTPTGGQRVRQVIVDALNLFLPATRQLSRPVPLRSNVLLIAATNRADNLDPALLRPGRFDRRLSFEPPSTAGRRALVDHLLARRAHAAELDAEDRRDALAGVTQGYTPVMIEHLMDEAAVNAIRRGETALTWPDIERARLTEEVGLGQPVAYTDHERRLIATHESGHAVVAWLAAPHRRLEVLTIIKRRGSLGLLAHSDTDEVFTRSRSEMIALIQIALGGLVAEELFFGDSSTGPSGDLHYATNVAAQMVGACGMTGSLISLAAVENGALSDTNLVGRVVADVEGRRQVEALLSDQKQIVRGLLEQNSGLITALRDALLDRHELIGTEITDVLTLAQAWIESPPADTVLDLRDSANAS
jgi:cell division protease FtsH